MSFKIEGERLNKENSYPAGHTGRRRFWNNYLKLLRLAIDPVNLSHSDQPFVHEVPVVPFVARAEKISTYFDPISRQNINDSVKFYGRRVIGWI